MVRTLRFLSLTMLFCVFAVVPQGHCRPGDRMDLCEELWGKQFNTYIADPVDSSGKAAESLNTLKEALEDELAGRMNIRFIMTDKREDSDLVIECDVRSFYWKDNTKNSGEGLGSAIFGVLTSENEGRMGAFFTVTDLHTKKVIWDGLVEATVNSKGVAAQEGVEMLNERLAKMFVKNCFAKKKLRAAFPTRKEDPAGSF